MSQCRICVIKNILKHVHVIFTVSSFILIQHGDHEVGKIWSYLQHEVDQLFNNCDILPALVHGDLFDINIGQINQTPGKCKNHHKGEYWNNFFKWHISIQKFC